MMALGETPSTIPATQGGLLDLLRKGVIGGLGSGNRSSSQSTAVGGNANVSVNPTIVNSFGQGGAQVSPYNYAPASGSPSGSGTSSAAGSDTPSWLSTGAVRSAPGPMAGYLDPITGKVVDAGSDWIMPAAIGGAALLFLMMEG